MAQIPLVANFQGDFVSQLVAIDDSATMAELAGVCASHSVNRRVAEQPGKTLAVKRPDDDAFWPASTRVADSGLTAMDVIEVHFVDPD